MDMQVRAISEKHNIKISIVDISEGLQEIVTLQNTNPLASVALGRVIINSTLTSLSVKDNSKVNTVVQGNGLAGTIITEFQDNKFRGYVANPSFSAADIKIGDDELSPLSQTVGAEGFLQISRDMGKKDIYTSRVELVSGEINLDFMYYLQQSDQVHSFISSTVDIDDFGKVIKAVGIMIQMLPGAVEEDIDMIEEKIGSPEHLNKTLLATTNYTSLIEDICEDAKVLDTFELKYECSCNKEKVISSIKLLGAETLKEIKDTGEAVEVTCDFCRKQYVIEVSELTDILH